MFWVMGIFDNFFTNRAYFLRNLTLPRLFLICGLMVVTIWQNSMRYISFSFILLTSFLVWSCSKNSGTSAPETGTITGIIVDTANNPVAKALIQSTPPSSQIFSSSDGSYTLEDLAAGQYTVTASKTNIGNGSAVVTVTAGKTTTAVIMLTPGPVTTGILIGTVVDSNNSPVSGAEIKTSPTTITTTSDVNGKFSIPNLNPGSYGIIASKSGYQNGTKTISIVAGQTANVTVRLGSQGAYPTEGLLAYYQFEGDGIDASGNGHTLTIQNGSFLPSRSGAGTALHCDGATEAVALHDPSLDPASVTVSLWLKASNPHLANSVGVVILSKFIGGSANGYMLWLDGSLISFIFGTGGPNTFSYIDNSSVLDNGWHSIICTADSKGTSMYFDGVIACSGIWQGGTPGTPTQTNPLTIGFGRDTSNNDSGFFSGTIDDVRIYNRVLTSAEITALAHEQ
jgi:hypothetical protein